MILEKQIADFDNPTLEELSLLKTHVPVSAIDPAGLATTEMIFTLQSGGLFPPRIRDDNYRLERGLIRGASLQINIAPGLAQMYEDIFGDPPDAPIDYQQVAADIGMDDDRTIWLDRPSIDAKYLAVYPDAALLSSLDRANLTAWLQLQTEPVAKAHFTEFAPDDIHGLSYRQLAAYYYIDESLSKDDIFSRIFQRIS